MELQGLYDHVYEQLDTADAGRIVTIDVNGRRTTHHAYANDGRLWLDHEPVAPDTLSEALSADVEGRGTILVFAPHGEQRCEVTALVIENGGANRLSSSAAEALSGGLAAGLTFT